MDPLVVYYSARVIVGFLFTMYGLIYHLQTGQVIMLDMLVARIEKNKVTGLYYYEEDKTKFTYTIGVFVRNLVVYGMPPIAETVLFLMILCIFVFIKCWMEQLGKIEIKSLFTNKDK